MRLNSSLAYTPPRRPLALFGSADCACNRLTWRRAARTLTRLQPEELKRKEKYYGIESCKDRYVGCFC